MFKEMDGIRMAQAMRTLKWKGEATFANQSLKGIRDRGGLDLARRRAHSQEHSAKRGWRWRALQMLD